MTSPEDLKSRVRRIVERDGLPVACTALGVSITTISRLLADLPVREGSRALLRERLDRLGAAPAPSEAPAT